MKLNAVGRRIWNSPTLMTWLSYFAKSGNLLFVLPLILKKFAAPEIALWYFFASILSISGLADFGFRNTFIRLFALAYGGAKDIGIFNDKSPSSKKEPNWQLVEVLYSSMKKIYIYTSLGLVIVLFSVGSYSLIKPISATTDHRQAWLSWVIIGCAIIFDFYGKVYNNYLEGLYEIALVKRIEFFSKLSSIATSFLVLLFAPSILNLVIAHSIWMTINTTRNYYLSRMVKDGKLKSFNPQPFEREFFLKIWRPAWRGGISGLMSQGLTNMSGILYAQVGNPAAVAAYMIALRLITEIRNISNAPFYSKIPIMVRLRAEGNDIKLISVAQRGMRLAHLVYTVGAIGVGLFFSHFLTLIGSQVHFVDSKLWLLLSLAFYFHRYGALHMQLYNTTNHIISHIVDTVAGIIFICSSLLLIKNYGLYAIPIGMIIGYLAFYSWVAAYYSLKSLKTSFFKYEYNTSLIPAGLFIIYTIIAILQK